jgi:hypothetical protein
VDCGPRAVEATTGAGSARVFRLAERGTAALQGLWIPMKGSLPIVERCGGVEVADRVHV